MENKSKKLLKTLVKLLITGLALYFVFSNISWSEVRGLLLNADFTFLIIAILFFAFSKALSAFRLQVFFKAIPLFISNRYNLKLAWVGMFYNLFLPGGIGGDGYKVYLLKNKQGVGVKLLVQAMLLDRVSGLISLLILAGIGFLFLDLSILPNWIRVLDLIGLVLAVPAFYFLTKVLFKTFDKVVIVSLIWSFGVQLMQVISAVLILKALGISKSYIAYCVLFLVSSFVSILPFTIGGLGSREFTFMIGYQYFGIEESFSIALSLLFTLISALLSFGGVFMRFKDDES